MICASEVLPSPGGPASRTWSSASPRPLRRVERDPELLLDALLADELGERAGPERAARAPPRRRRRRRARATRLAHAALFSAERTCSSTGSDSSTSASARSASSSDQPSSTSASRASEPAAGGGRGERRARRACPSAPSRRAARSCARCPGIASKRARSSRAIARRSSAGGEPETIASATFGPIPVTPSSSSKSSRSSARREAVELQRVLADVEVGLDRHLLADARRVTRGVAATR